MNDEKNSEISESVCDIETSWSDNPAVVKLLKTVLLQEIIHNENSYITCETLIQRIVRKMMLWFHVSELPLWNSSADLFQTFHSVIKNAYEAKKKNLTAEEQVCVERVLSKDAPHANELIKFATVWMRHDPRTTYKWFAVDGTLGPHPKLYVHEAFSSHFVKHTTAIRHLYEETGIETPDEMKMVVQDAFDTVYSGDSFADMLVSSNNLYLRLAGEETTKRMRQLRAAKTQTTNVKSSSTSKRQKKEELHHQEALEIRSGLD